MSTKLQREHFRADYVKEDLVALEKHAWSLFVEAVHICGQDASVTKDAREAWQSAYYTINPKPYYNPNMSIDGNRTNLSLRWFLEEQFEKLRTDMQDEQDKWYLYSANISLFGLNSVHTKMAMQEWQDAYYKVNPEIAIQEDEYV